MKTSRRDFFKAIGKLAMVVPFVDLRQFLPSEEKNVDAQDTLIELNFEDNGLDLSNQSQVIILTSYTTSSSNGNIIYRPIDFGKGNSSSDNSITYAQSNWIEL